MNNVIACYDLCVNVNSVQEVELPTTHGKAAPVNGEGAR